MPNVYFACKRNNTADAAYMAVVAADLYRATGERGYLDYVKKGADKLISLMGEGDAAMCVQLDDDDAHLAFMCSNYAHSNGGFMALCAACESLENNEVYLEALRKIAVSICKLARKNPWFIYRSAYSDADLDMVFGHPAPGRYLPSQRELLGQVRYIGSIGKDENEIKCYTPTETGSIRVTPLTVSTAGVFLMRAAKLLGDREIGAVAQSQIDAILAATAMTQVM